MVQFKLPSPSQLTDKQFISVEGPDGLVSSFVYDKETQTLYAKESQIIIPPFHGLTHINEDRIPDATVDTPGLMSPSDKAKLEELTKTRIGVLGFQGSGQSDDGGYLQGDIILASGSEFITLERVGNIVRFNVNNPIPLNCNIEECAQIFWIQDETDRASIRPPTCAGKLPGVNGYGELKFFLFPANTIVNSSQPSTTLNNKGSYPALLFRRYANSVTPNQAEFHLVLSRNNDYSARVGWVMTPGATGTPVAAWFMGQDNDGNQIRFDLKIEGEPGLLGSLLYKGHTITRQMAVITDYTSNVLANNQYQCKFWNVKDAKIVGDVFTATNVWKYNNVGNSPTALSNPQSLVLDATVDVLPIGTLVSIWEFKIGEVNGSRLVQRFFSHQPSLNPATLWNLGGVIRFGDLLTSTAEIPDVSRPTELTSHNVGVSDIRLIERTQWGLTGFEDRLYLSDDGIAIDTSTVEVSDIVNAINNYGLYNPTNPTVDDPKPSFKIQAKNAASNPALEFSLNAFADHGLIFTSGTLINKIFKIIENTASTITCFDPDGLGIDIKINDTFNVVGLEVNTDEPSGNVINNQYVADIDPARPGLIISETPPKSDVERPVFLWHRANYKNVYIKALVGRPSSSRFPPIDLLFQAPIDSLDDRYIKIVKRGRFDTGAFKNQEYIVVKGLNWNEIPQIGDLRILTGYFRNEVWKYYYKAAFARFDDNATILIGSNVRFPFDSDIVPDKEGTGGTNANSGTESERSTITIPNTTTVAQILHQDYSASALRIEFSVNDNTTAESLQMQFKGGILDVGTSYELNLSNDVSEDFVKGMRPGSYSVSKVYTQQGFISTGTETPKATPEGFKVYDGGFIPQVINGENEIWNLLEVMYRDGQLWVWWNKLLIPPDTVSSAALPTPVAVTTPYFPVPAVVKVGKVGLRLWPGAVVREFEVRSQMSAPFNEFSHGQLQLVAR